MENRYCIVLAFWFWFLVQCDISRMGPALYLEDDEDERSALATLIVDICVCLSLCQDVSQDV